MILRTKLLLSFAAVLAVVITTGLIMTTSLQTMIRQSQVVDKVDSGVVTALTAQGRAVRYVLYKDKTYADQATQGLADAQKIFESGRAVVTTPRNIQLLEGQLRYISDAETAFNSVIRTNTQQKEIDTKLLPIAKGFSETVDKFRSELVVQLNQNYTQQMMDMYVALVAIGDAFRESRLAARMYTIVLTPDQERLALDALMRVSSMVKSLEKMNLRGRGEEHARTMLTLLTEYEQLFRNMITNAGEGITLNRQFRDVLVKMVADGVELSRAATENLLRTGNSSQTYMYGGTALLTLMCIAIALLLTRNILTQLGKDPGVLAHIATRVTNGDYNIDDGSPKIGVYGNVVSMVGALKEHIENSQRETARAAEESRNAQVSMQKAEVASNEAKAKTQSMLTAADKLEEVADIVSSASAELSAQIEQSERGASEQAARVAETATAMEEMNSTVLEVARNAGAASDVSSRTREKAEAGALVVRQVVSSIQQVWDQANQLKQDMAELAESAKAIDQIMGVISDIADQTNLLALNAAIEAARAGEAGRGFAVVADEVRKLAEKTMSSTTDVGNAIRAIQQSAKRSMEQADLSSKSIEEATVCAKQSGEALQEIVALVDNTADQVRAIATASEEQSASSEEINQSITQVSSIAGETARAMEEAARAISDLAAQAQALSTLIEEMKRG